MTSSTTTTTPAPTTGTDHAPLRAHVPEPPRGLTRLRWWGPGLLWAMSAVGSGSVLFTPRVGSRYGYAFLWLLLGVATLMWVMIRESGRYAVVTGRTLLDGFSSLPGPRNWALWVVFVPQLVAAVAGVAGLSALVGSALAAELPGGLVPWSLSVLAASTAVVVSGGYRAVSRVALVLALVLVAITAAAAVGVFQPDGDAVSGLVPGAPSDLDVPFLLPWIGTILAGSMGIIWYSYWAATRGYGGGTADLGHGEGSDEPTGDGATPEERTDRLVAWFRTLSNTAIVGVATGTLIITAFLVLGAELLGPAGVVPSGIDVATDLTRLLSETWGRVGHWLMFAAIIVALGGSVLANQDGWSRSFADIAILLQRREPSSPAAGTDEDTGRLMRIATGWRPSGMGTRRALKIVFAASITALIPAVVIVLVRNPVTIMSASGIIATIHTPFIVFATLAVNRRIQGRLGPSLTSKALLALSGLFYTVFGLLYFADLFGLLG